MAEPQLMIDTLLKEYDHRFDEVMFHSERYHKQADVLQLFLTSVIALGTILLSDKIRESLVSNMSLVKRELILSSFFIFGALLVLFFFSSIMNSLFMIYLNGARIAALEQQINDLSGKELLNWDSKAMPYFFGLDMPMGKQHWIKPTVIAGSWIMIIFIFICVVLSYLCFQFVHPLAPFYIPAIVLLCAFHIYQWILLIKIGVREIRDYFLTGKGSPTPPGIHADYIIYVIPVLAVMMMTVSSLQSNTFGFSSQYTFPLLSIPSIYIGDAFILPFLNYKIMLWLKSSRSLWNIFLRPISILMILASAVGEWWIHYRWTHDPWQGFMDTAYGKLTLAGWVHYIFSSVELWLIMLFLITWIRAGLRRDPKIFGDGLRICLTLLIFCSVAFADFAVKYLFIFKHQDPAFHPVQDGIFTTFPFLLVLSIYTFASRLNTKISSQPVLSSIQ